MFWHNMGYGGKNEQGIQVRSKLSRALFALDKTMKFYFDFAHSGKPLKVKLLSAAVKVFYT